jgi:hypothetical protein
MIGNGLGMISGGHGDHTLPALIITQGNELDQCPALFK